MIILDFSKVVYSTILINNDEKEINEDLLRHMIVNSIRASYMNYKNGWGDLVIAIDGKNYWRKQVFPHYKANRAKAREKINIDWNLLFTTVDKIKQEIKEHFPYRVIEIDNCEADDIIATLCFNRTEPIMILSGDRDLLQLQDNTPIYKISQYDTIHKRMISHPNPPLYLKEHIIRGDSSDGIPNIMSDDDTFVTAKRQKKVMTKKLEQWLNLEPEEFCDTIMLRNYYRNKMLIDLSSIPNDIQENIKSHFKDSQANPRSKIFNYLREHKLKNLMEHLNDF